LNLVGGRARQQRVSVREDFSSVPVVVEGDPEQLHQVFVNLLLNGIEALPQGGQMGVSIRGPEQADGRCRVSVRDSGSGIPAAIMERLFEPFVTGKEGGTGLGLPVSQRIVKQHGGRLIAVNRDDAGAEFVMELPVAHRPSCGAGDGMDAASSPRPRV
jgi:signal transduction histidine kinase